MSRYRAVECGGARVGLYTEGGGDRYREGAVMNVLDPLSPEWTRAEDDEKLDLNDPRVTMKFQGIPSVPVSEAAAGTILVSSRSIAADIEEFAHAAADTEEEAEKLRGDQSLGEFSTRWRRILNDRLMLAERGFHSAELVCNHWTAMVQASCKNTLQIPNWFAITMLRFLAFLKENGQPNINIFIKYNHTKMIS
ncbi:uncharacterized protein LOC142544669 isoform X1 [Primulina tabacum]|uniref:uncharacterized protein LOC142544669 isoform X1 n=1 Tax=Primulina tabacum TaxID=48773 RepID=UPI003F594811